MNKSIIVAGIGTEIGKTLISAILTQALQADYWKPIQSGNPEDADALFIKKNDPITPFEGLGLGLCTKPTTFPAYGSGD